jgi:DNA mismatch endonuclease Vsr
MDKLTPEQRHKNMVAVKNKNTDIEMSLRKLLWNNGFRYRKNNLKVYGKPDIVFVGKKIAIFCDGDFWHGYDFENQKETIKSNQIFWKKKIENNIRHDILITAALESEGWIVLRFWGHDIKKHPEKCLQKVREAFETRKE